MHIGIFMFVVPDKPLDHRPGPLGRRGIIKPHEIAAIHFFSQDWKIGAYRIKAPRADVPALRYE
jgi:hypothetical protein